MRHAVPDSSCQFPALWSMSPSVMQPRTLLSSPSSSSSLPPSPPCSSMAANGFLQGGMAGTIYGLLLGSSDVSKKLPDSSLSTKTYFVLRKVARHGLSWGSFAGLYLGFRCSSEVIRQKQDWVNALIAGCLSGAMLSPVVFRASNPRSILVTSCAFGAVAASTDLFMHGGGGDDVALGWHRTDAASI